MAIAATGSSRWSAPAAPRARSGAFVWLGVVEPTAEEFESIAREFGLHELAVEDAVKAHQRPKVELYGETLFVVVKTARYVDSEEVIEIGELMLFVNPGFIVTVRHGEGELSRGPGRGSSGAPTCSRTARAWSSTRSSTTSSTATKPRPRGSTSTSRRSSARSSPRTATTRPSGSTSWSARCSTSRRRWRRSPRSVDEIARGHFEVVPDDLREYFRDVHDHLRRVAGRIAGFRELLGSALHANLTQVSVRQNEDMRKISAWVAILAVPTMIAGIYGMNFEHMPELEWRFGYPAVLFVIALACLLLYRRFKRAGWL